MKKIASAIAAAALGATLAIACGGKAAPAEEPAPAANPCNPCATDEGMGEENPCNPCGMGDDMGGDTYGGDPYGG